VPPPDAAAEPGANFSARAEVQPNAEPDFSDPKRKRLNYANVAENDGERISDFSVTRPQSGRIHAVSGKPEPAGS
jgi:hypothetical protein